MLAGMKDSDAILSRRAFLIRSAMLSAAGALVVETTEPAKAQICLSDIDIEGELIQPTAYGLVIYFKGVTLEPTGDLSVQLEALASRLESDTTARLIIHGHTDASLPPLEAEALSEARAHLICEELIELGVARERLSVQAHGSQYPEATNLTEEGRMLNNRVDFKVIY